MFVSYFSCVFFSSFPACYSDWRVRSKNCPECKSLFSPFFLLFFSLLSALVLFSSCLSSLPYLFSPRIQYTPSGRVLVTDVRRNFAVTSLAESFLEANPGKKRFVFVSFRFVFCFVSFCVFWGSAISFRLFVALSLCLPPFFLWFHFSLFAASPSFSFPSSPVPSFLSFLPSSPLPSLLLPTDPLTNFLRWTSAANNQVQSQTKW